MTQTAKLQCVLKPILTLLITPLRFNHVMLHLNVSLRNKLKFFVCIL